MLDIFSASGFLVHKPCGPRKSGMPESVEMPAPVRTTTRLAASTQERAFWIKASGSCRRPVPPIGGSGPCGTTIDEAAWRRSSCSSFTVRSIASFASWPNFSAASSSEPAPISKAMGSAPAGVSTCVSPT